MSEKTATKPKVKKDTILIARINRRVKQVIAEIAQGDGKTLTGYLEALVERDLKGRKVKIDEIDL